jgi:hypothetical protein
MTESLARYHCRLRGLSIRFSGSGSTVIAQEPGPGSRASGGELACVLARPELASVIGLSATPIRQAMLLRKLGSRELALYHRQ